MGRYKWVVRFRKRIGAGQKENLLVKHLPSQGSTVHELSTPRQKKNLCGKLCTETRTNLTSVARRAGRNHQFAVKDQKKSIGPREGCEAKFTRHLPSGFFWNNRAKEPRKKGNSISGVKMEARQDQQREKFPPRPHLGKNLRTGNQKIRHTQVEERNWGREAGCGKSGRKNPRTKGSVGKKEKRKLNFRGKPSIANRL